MSAFVFYYLVENPEFDKQYDWNKVYREKFERLEKLKEQGCIDGNIDILAKREADDIISSTFKRYKLEEVTLEEENFLITINEIEKRKDFVKWVNEK